MDRRTVYITIIVSVLLHLGVLYYIAMTWGIVPNVLPEPEEQVLAVAPPPPPSPVKVPPVPLKPQPPAETTADATTILSDKQIIDNPVSRPPIRYPRRAEEQEKEGVVRVRVTIQPDGTVTDVVVVSARPPGWFEQAAIDGVKRWRYKAPGRVVVAEVDVEFKLN